MGDYSRETQRFRLDIAYDGSFFHGWAQQANQRTVAGVLDEKLTLMLEQEVVLFAAGRTDAGVHALGQVAHMDVYPHKVLHNIPRLIRRCAKFLPPDIRVRTISPVPPEFDARFSALSREYRYTISTDIAGVNPLDRYKILSYPYTLDLKAMNEASHLLQGMHDFAGFCRHKQNATTIRNVYEFQWLIQEPSIIYAKIIADAFCWSMVRALVGAVLQVGKGRKDITWTQEILHRSKRESDVPLVPAHGLCLVQVNYPPADHYAERSQQTRARRQFIDLSTVFGATAD